MVPAYMKDERRVLRFDAVTHNAKVYLNQELVMTHKGGFLPFEIDITDLIPAGEKALLGVAVDNRVNHGTLPVGNEDVAFFGSDNPGIPSVESAKQARRKQNFPNFDFFNFSGIHRPVRIYTTPVSYIEDIVLVPDISGTDGIVSYEVRTGGAHSDNEVAVKFWMKTEIAWRR